MTAGDLTVIGTHIDNGEHPVKADLHLDGKVTRAEAGEIKAAYEDVAFGRGALSGCGSRRGFKGYSQRTYSSLHWNSRMRVLLADMGVWGQRDFDGYVDGANLYRAFVGRPLRYLDPLGAEILDIGPDGENVGGIRGRGTGSEYSWGTAAKELGDGEGWFTARGTFVLRIGDKLIEFDGVNSTTTVRSKGRDGVYLMRAPAEWTGLGWCLWNGFGKGHEWVEVYDHGLLLAAAGMDGVEDDDDADGNGIPDGEETTSWPGANQMVDHRLRDPVEVIEVPDADPGVVIGRLQPGTRRGNFFWGQPGHGGDCVDATTDILGGTDLARQRRIEELRRLGDFGQDASFDAIPFY